MFMMMVIMMMMMISLFQVMMEFILLEFFAPCGQQLINVQRNTLAGGLHD
jgi:hypothetical protein